MFLFHLASSLLSSLASACNLQPSWKLCAHCPQDYCWLHVWSHEPQGSSQVWPQSPPPKAPPSPTWLWCRWRTTQWASARMERSWRQDPWPAGTSGDWAPQDWWASCWWPSPPHLPPSRHRICWNTPSPPAVHCANYVGDQMRKKPSCVVPLTFSAWNLKLGNGSQGAKKLHPLMNI